MRRANAIPRHVRPPAAAAKASAERAIVGLLTRMGWREWFAPDGRHRVYDNDGVGRAHGYYDVPAQRFVGLQCSDAEFEARSRAAIAVQPSPDYPDTLGWRIWGWDADSRRLTSPSRDTIWHTKTLQAPKFTAHGRDGIYARLVPADWRSAPWGAIDRPAWGAPAITGIVERYGQYELGDRGWRSEIATIRELQAPAALVDVLQAVYADVVAFSEEVAG